MEVFTPNKVLSPHQIDDLHLRYLHILGRDGNELDYLENDDGYDLYIDDNCE